MVPRPAAVRPVALLSEQATALEAAITLCLAKPTVKSVHTIRSATRRIEAQLYLIDALPNVPLHDKQTRKLRKRLAKLRRMAGRVRDLDVLSDKLKHRQEEPKLWDHPGAMHLSKDGQKLRKAFQAQRSAQAEELVDLLRTCQSAVARALQKLLDVLAPAAALSLSSNRLIEIALRFFSERVEAPSGTFREDDLHDTRKAAKLTRYMLESAPKSSGDARQLAATFEALQQIGGRWHDLLTLTQKAKRQLGRHSPLAAHAGELRDASRTRYQVALHDLRTE